MRGIQFIIVALLLVISCQGYKITTFDPQSDVFRDSEDDITLFGNESSNILRLFLQKTNSTFNLLSDAMKQVEIDVFDSIPT